MTPGVHVFQQELVALMAKHAATMSEEDDRVSAFVVARAIVNQELLGMRTLGQSWFALEAFAHGVLSGVPSTIIATVRDGKRKVVEIDYRTRMDLMKGQADLDLGENLDEIA